MQFTYRLGIDQVGQLALFSSPFAVGRRYPYAAPKMTTHPLDRNHVWDYSCGLSWHSKRQLLAWLYPLLGRLV